MKNSVFVLLGIVASAASAQSIYTCVDANGRKLTADRPIMECLDREQSIMSSSGMVTHKLPPSLTGPERAAQDAKDKAAAAERERIAAEKQRDRALLTRYANKAAHDQVRADAIAPINLTIQTIQYRLAELEKQRTSLQAEMEFYKKDPTKAPLKVRNQMEENAKNQADQRQLIATQEKEINRVNARFDEELARLNHLWSTALPASAPAAAASR